MRGPVKAAFVSLAALSAAACAEPDTRPAPKVRAEAVPPAPAWAVALLGRPLRSVFRKDTTCTGATDMVEVVYRGARPGVLITGWGWDPAGGQPVPRVVLVDDAYRIVAAGEARIRRPDVPNAHPEITSDLTGWGADVPLAEGIVTTYGVLPDGQTVCKLGGLKF